MTNELTLRKISKVVSKIDGRIHELSRDVHGNVTARVVIHDDVSSMLIKVKETHEDYDRNRATLLSLIDMRVTLRSALGSMNQTAGINHLVTELRGLEQKLGVIGQLQRAAPEETQLPEDTLTRRMEARAEAAKSATIDVGGYGRVGRDESTTNLPVLTDWDVEHLKATEKQLEDQIEAVHDKLEQLNAVTAIELPEDIVKELKDLEIIS